ncbi:PfkB family carbohydrate kinase [Micromonospora sp. WMMD975]|uniref:PfkB family carbohydrate kinase n=1 Tax=Micromonospora sp. WMMD975 TaxID=3016087 RepID=UPI00249A1135|nr:PfkB family carbohydrate kinase [Micromonospora sp. WMMD975]WFE36430.1 PfkB family carbohydrate kinase [Micromonospora sp. WMMD975]
MSGRLLVVGLATSLDRYAWLPSFAAGTINRPTEVVARAGGKGLNAARAAAGLGADVRAIALTGGATGRTVRALGHPAAVRFVDSGVETRQCLCLLDAAGVLTEVYEPVLPVSSEIWPSVVSAVADELATADLLALSGRVPPGLGVDALAELVDLAHAAGVPVIVDSDGPALVAALRRGPTMVKVNETEAAAVTDDGPAGLAALGARSVVVTGGATGARYLGEDGRQIFVTHDAIPGAVPVGSGDAFLAGLAAQWLIDAAPAPNDPGTVLRVAAAAARANARRLPAGDITRESVDAELASVRVRPV